jgi:hypothetical protein
LIIENIRDLLLKRVNWPLETTIAANTFTLFSRIV